MQHTTFRLDDIARDVTHYAPEVLFELYAPLEAPCAVTWHEWTPALNESWRGWTVRTDIRRLDTQMSPQRWLPDVAYTCVARGIHEFWGCELQSAARHYPTARASTCFAQLSGQAFPKLPLGHIESRLIEVRTLHAPRIAAALPEPKTAFRRRRHTVLRDPVERDRSREGLLRFEPSDALCKLDPNDRRFSHPRCWPLVCLSHLVSADHIVLRLARLEELEKSHAVPFSEVRLLLGYVGRVRFPKDARIERAMEYIVNDSAAHSAMDFGHMTEEERRRILMDAKERQTRIHEESLKDAKRAGLQEGERNVLLALAARLAPERLAELEAMADTDELQRAVFALAGR